MKNALYDNDAWKTALLRSGMPLELSAARHLTENGFSVNADFHYSWSPSADHRDTAVDLRAEAVLPASSSEDRPGFQTDLLINCASRPSEAVWLFLPDPNPPEKSPLAFGSAVRSVDQFSPFILPLEKADLFDSAMPACYRSTEIDTRSGEYNSGEYMNGLARLQNALPRFLTEKVDLYLSAPRQENRPFLFCPILITDAPLYILRKEIKQDEIQNAGQMKEIADKTDRLIFYANFTPEFKQRCMSEAETLRPHLGSDKAMEIEMKKVRHYNSRTLLPFTIIEALSRAEYAYLCSFFSQFIICSNDAFSRMVKELTEVFSSLSESRQLLF